MHAFDIVFYIGVSYHFLNQLNNILRFDLSVLRAKRGTTTDAHIKATNYYLHRKESLLYKAAPLFCLALLTGIIGNLVRTHDTALASGILALVLAPVGIMVNVKFVIPFVVQLKSGTDGADDTPSDARSKLTGEEDEFGNDDALKNIAIGHLLAVMNLSAMLVCIIVKF